MSTAFLLVIFSLVNFQPNPQDTLTLEYCHMQIEENYPIANKIDLQDDITALNKKIAGTALYPQVSFSTTATYQSEVTKIQFSTTGQFSPPSLSKDQYKATVDVSQTIFNGGAVNIRKKLEEAQGNTQNNVTKVELRKVKEQVKQVYFGILLAQQQLQVISTLMKNLKAQIREVSSKVDHGALLPSQQYILEAELINVQQDSSEIQTNISSGYRVLSQLIGEEITTDTQLEIPEIEMPIKEKMSRLRSEFDLFDSNRQALDYQEELAQSQKFPSLSAFGTAAYGRPGFDVFNDDLHTYYMVGVKLKWNFWNARNAAKKQQLYQLKQKSITEEERAFKRQLSAGLNKIREQIMMLEEKMKRDQEIIALREKVVAEKSSQMKNGSVTATEYITELSKATQARLSKMIHQTKLAQTKVEYKIAAGITNK